MDGQNVLVFVIFTKFVSLETGDDGKEEADDMEAEVDPADEDDDDEEEDETYLVISLGGLLLLLLLLLLANIIFTGLFMSSVILFRKPTRLKSSIFVVDVAEFVWCPFLNGFFLFINDRK